MLKNRFQGILSQTENEKPLQNIRCAGAVKWLSQIPSATETSCIFFGYLEVQMLVLHKDMDENLMSVRGGT